MPPAPYPYASWPRVSGEALTGVRRWRAALIECDSFAALESARELLGAALEVSLGVPAGPAAGDANDAGKDGLLHPQDVALVWSLEGATGRTALLWTLPSALAAQLVDRVLGGDGDSVHLPGTTLDDLSLGALGYLAARVAAAAGGRLRLAGLSARASDIREPVTHHDALIWPLEVTLDGRRWMTRGLTGARPAANDDSATHLRDRALPNLRLELCAHAGTVTLTVDQLESLGIGDALLPVICPLTRDAAGFRGEVRMHVVGARRTQWVCLAEGSRLQLDRIEQNGEGPMTEGKRMDTGDVPGEGGAAPASQLGAALAGDAPIEVCLELARFTLSLDELGKLAPGDVLGTGQPIGEHVTLRAGGTVFGHGQLVDVDGDVGVRLTRLERPQ